jgi:AcrR family transcriptional regulator
MQQRPARRKPETRRLLLAAAAELFLERGTIGHRVEEIANRAGFTRGAFYSNFATVDELYLALHQEQAVGVWAHIRQALAREASDTQSHATLEAAVGHILDSLPSDREWFSLHAVLLAKAAADPVFADALSLDRDDVAHELGEQFAALARIHGREPVVAPTVLAKAVVAAHIGAVGLTPVDQDALATRRTVVVAVLRGLTADTVS